jgi:hypothetical protein
MSRFSAELTALRANLCAAYDAANRWREQAAKDPRCKPEQLQIQHVRLLSRTYCEFKAKLEAAQA